MGVVLGVCSEREANEQRVALVPEVVKKFQSLGASVIVEAGAGSGALIPDSAFTEAEIVPDRATVLSRADMLLTVQPPTPDIVAGLRSGTTIVGFFSPHRNLDIVKAMQDRNITSLAMELVPRITRAQSMDALSSQAAIAGYKAVLIAAQTSGKFFPMLTTAAGTIRPSKVLVIGAGVAGLQALATARRLGAITTGYDVRPETKEQVQSLGARFLDISVQASGEGGYARELTEEEKAEQQRQLAEHIAGQNVVITTAAIPGRPSPKIISTAMVDGMAPGSVIVDIAAEGGGNCEVTKAGETVIHNDVAVVGPVNLASQMPIDASDMYARNLYNLLSPMFNEGQFEPNWEDEVMAGCVLTRDGEVCHQPTKELLQGQGS